MRTKIGISLMVAAFGLLVCGGATAQIVIHEETAWVGPPFPMGDYDSQVVPLSTVSYGGPSNPAAACFILPPVPGAPLGFPGPTLWHPEIDCCAVGAGAPPGWFPTFAAYNTGAGGGFTYAVGANAGALSSYGIGGVSLRPPSPIAAGQLIVLCFDYVKIHETPTTTAFDTSYVEVRPAPCGEPAALDPAGAPLWTTISVLSTANNTCATPITCCIGPFNPALDGTFITPPGAPVGGKIRFRFNSVDAAFNGYCGWSVDNVELTNEECAPSCPGALSPTIGSFGAPPFGAEAISPNPTYGISLTGAPPGGLAILNIAPANVPPLPLPFPPGCLACCPPFILFPAIAVPAAGSIFLPVPIPPGIPPCVSEVCVQWFIVTPLAPISVISSSAGKVRFQIG